MFYVQWMFRSNDHEAEFLEREPRISLFTMKAMSLARREATEIVSVSQLHDVQINQLGNRLIQTNKIVRCNW
jgi:hypothetical protein